LEEPSNAVLAAQLENLTTRLEKDHEDHTAHQNRMEAKLEALTQLIAGIETRVAVERARADAEHAKLGEKIREHEALHERQAEVQKAERAQGATTSMLIVGLLTAFGTIGGAVVVLLVH
jgi:septal ring factor EnvC (AmiA/AmiB activator)